MNRLLMSIAVSAAALALAITGCTQPAAPAPTAAPAPPKAAEPTKAPVAAPTKAPAAAPTTVVAQPTAVPKPKVEFPEKGKAITLMVPWAPGGSTDVSARVLAPYMERDLGVPVQVVNKPGASSQVGVAELAMSKPDGYMVGYTSLPQVPVLYLDAERKATFGRKDLQQVAMYTSEALMIAVRADSPYRSMKDIVDAARAKPDKMTASETGLMSTGHLGVLQLGKLAGVQFASVHFDSGGPQMTAMLGGNIDFHFGWTGEIQPQYKSGTIRVIAIMGRERSPFWPDIPTTEEQGYKVNTYADRGWSVAAGTPKEIVDILAQSIKKAMENPELKKKTDELAMPLRYMGPAEYTAYWDQVEQEVRPLIQLSR